MADGTHGNDAILSARGISLTLSGKRILSSITLSFARGEFVGIIGPNGSGKTSLLRVLDGLFTPDTGEIVLKGKPLASYRPKERAREISFMMQGESDAVTFSVLEVLLAGRYPYRSGFRQDTEEETELAREMLAYVGLEGFEGRRFDTLSSGEQQLVLFARTLVQSTDLILLDEPTSNLDISHQEQIFTMAEELASAGKTVVAAIHNINEASRYCSRLVLLDSGRVAADGSAEDVVRPEVMDGPFRVQSVTVQDVVTGAPEIRLLPSRRQRRNPPSFHLAGSGRMSLELLRELYRSGCRISGSPVQAGSSEALLRDILNVETGERLRTQSSAEAHGPGTRSGTAVDYLVVCNPADPAALSYAASRSAGAGAVLVLVPPGGFTAEERNDIGRSLDPQGSVPLHFMTLEEILSLAERDVRQDGGNGSGA